MSKRLQQRVQRLEASRGRPDHDAIRSEASAKMREMCSSLQGGRTELSEHDAHGRAVGMSEDELFDNLIWRHAFERTIGATFEVVDGKPRMVKLDVEKMPDPLVFMLDLQSRARQWKEATRHDVHGCGACREAMLRRRGARV